MPAGRHSAGAAVESLGLMQKLEAERERERQRQRQTHTQRERERQRQRQRQRQRKRDRERERQTEREREREREVSPGCSSVVERLPHLLHGNSRHTKQTSESLPYKTEVAVNCLSEK